MKNNIFFITILLISLSGCITPSYQTTEHITPSQHEPSITVPTPVPSVETPAPVMTEKSDLLIDRISENLTSFYDRKWNTLYQADELDCSRMSTYFWDYIRRNFHVAPKIIISYERQHAWLILKVSDVGNSSDYSHWNIKGTDYYFVEATIPKVVAPDNRKFLINDREYTSSEFYNASVYVFDTPQDANDFQASVSSLGGWNQEFRMKKGDLDKIARLLGS
ncbi:MAG: hypothetical protein PHH85_14320 [Candidatus Methanoperedens sp.]|nr:hypothetical protein [Candidatus Methanoperedens sp.]